MKLTWLTVAGAVLLASAVQAEDAALKTDKDKASYTIGHGMGSNLKRQGVDIDVDQMARGIRDALAGSKPALSPEEMQQTMDNVRAGVMARQQAHMQAAAESNKKAGAEFLEKNKKAEGVKTLPSGLQYLTTTEGTGKSPGPKNKVTVHYRGTLLDGTEFDSSYARGEPATFSLDGVIPGWVEGMQLMKEGGKMRMFIPPELAYGSEGAGNVIGPESVLIFDVELLKVE